ITPAHVEEALESATEEPPTQGAVGGGAGTISYDFKGGIGSASRVVDGDHGRWTIGALVQTNYGVRRNLTIAGGAVALQIEAPLPPDRPLAAAEGSCLVVVATDAPLLPHQLRRLAVRACVGLTRSGSYTGHSSGEISVAFSTATRIPLTPDSVIAV